ncbi:RNA polymerase sigma-70 factor (sigma-E family) [Nonomuraea fuscirosea]|uniref:RNA polymerase sigma-70 factor (Sigma-E family) n=1 Tax=Nonomuraea fuscirosea TaxID=1291556 RepID=A0A2T0M5F0_9ACTN|nr:RNA polymerase sigma-70 factor (sigma-E family) [Nonomuraea fuscirosea]
MRDKADFVAFVEARSPRLLRTAYLLCRDWTQAEDLLQTALVRVWRAWGRVGEHPDAYVSRVLVNTHLSWRRRLWRRELPTDAPPETVVPDDEIGMTDERAVLWAALGRLPPRQRAVLVLRYFEDLPESVVAEILNCSIGTVKSQSSKALAKLRIDPEVAPTAVASRTEGERR